MDQSTPGELIINGEVYTKKQSVTGLPYVIARGDRSGVFAGYLEARNGKEIVLKDSRRLWYWSGAASISELSVNGTKKPGSCKFPVAVEHQEVLDVIELIPCTDKAKESIQGVPVWEA